MKRARTVAACLAAALSIGCASARGPIELGSSLAGASLESDWWRVRQLEPSAEILVTAQGAAPGTRYFVAADDARLISLNIVPAVPPAAARTLREIAARMPDRLVVTEKNGELRHGTVRGAIESVVGSR